jgi:hypothetical protein
MPSMPGEAHFTALRQLGMRLWQPDALASRLKGFLPRHRLPPLPGALR